MICLFINRLHFISKNKGKRMNKFIVCLLTAIFITMLGCQQKGSAESAGERVDEVVDNIKHGDAPFKEKGALEKMGESIDDSIKDVNKK